MPEQRSSIAILVKSIDNAKLGDEGRAFDEWIFTSQLSEIKRADIWNIVGSVLMALLSLFAFWNTKNFIALSGLVFFPLCAITFAGVLLWKRRYRDWSISNAAVQGGVPIRGNFVQLGIAGLVFFQCGIAFIYAGWNQSHVMLALGLVCAFFGSLLSFLVFSGRWPRAALQFDPTGLTLIRGPWRAHVPWNCIVKLSAVEFSGVPLLQLSLHRPDKMEIFPASLRKRALNELRGNLGTADIEIAAHSFAVDLPTLAAVIGKYAGSELDREELRERQIEDGTAKT